MPPLLWASRRSGWPVSSAAIRCRLVFTANVSRPSTSSRPRCSPAPGEILLTDHEYGAMHWCWERAAQRLGLTLRTFRVADHGRMRRRDRRRGVSRP